MEKPYKTAANEMNKILIIDTGSPLGEKLRLALSEGGFGVARIPGHPEDWRQRAEAVGWMIDELMTCFANIRTLAESLSARVQENGESPPKGNVDEIIRLAKSMEKKLLCFSRACALLAETSLTDSNDLIKPSRRLTHEGKSAY